MLTRLNKHLADLGIASRREADRLIEEGEVKVNGKVCTELGTKVDPTVDKVSVTDRAERADSTAPVYIMLHKPVGYVCAVKPTRQDPYTVMELVKVPERIYPVGRLDKDSTGLLILTNDGTLTFKLTHPSSQCEKEYEVTLIAPISDVAIQKIESGVSLLGEKTLPTKIKKVGPKILHIILKEGKNRQIRRICEKVGYPVRALKRFRVKKLMLGALPVGKWRHLSAEEVAGLKR